MAFQRRTQLDATIPVDVAPEVLERAAQILIRRKQAPQDNRLTQAAQSIGMYGEVVHGIKPARHHQQWLDALQRLVQGDIPNSKLLIIAPPGSAKSSWVGLTFPTWYLGSHPDKTVLFMTVSDTRAKESMTVVRSTLEGNEMHRAVFPSQSGTPDQMRGWSNDGLYLKGLPFITKDPSFRAVGYNSSIIGSRMDGLILDDPLSEQDVRSPAVLAAAKEYYDKTVSTRLKPGTWQVAIMTRWSEDDFAAHLMKQQPEWTVIHMPAIGYWGDGGALWPDYIPLSWLEEKKLELGGPVFEAIYQGNPTALGGDIFTSSEMFRPLPANLAERRKQGTIFQFWDTAFSDKDSADYSVCATGMIDRRSGEIFVIGMHRARYTAEELIKAAIDQWRLWRPSVIGIEDPAYRQAIVKDMKRRLMHAGVAAAIQTVKASGDKVMRARLPSSRMEAGLMYFDTTAPWFQDFSSECRGFPRMKHDDQVDALSGLTQLCLEKSGMGTRESVPYEMGLSEQRPPDVITPWTGARLKVLTRNGIVERDIEPPRNSQRYSMRLGRGGRGVA